MRIELRRITTPIAAWSSPSATFPITGGPLGWGIMVASMSHAKMADQFRRTTPGLLA